MLTRGAGHINHTLFWKNLAPTSSGGGQLTDGPLKEALERDFGSVEGSVSPAYPPLEPSSLIITFF